MKKYKFEELTPYFKDYAVKQYIAEWLETHPNETLSYDDAMMCCFDDDETMYSREGDIFYE